MFFYLDAIYFETYEKKNMWKKSGGINPFMHSVKMKVYHSVGVIIPRDYRSLVWKYVTEKSNVSQLFKHSLIKAGD